MTIHQVEANTNNGAETFKIQYPIIGTKLLVYNENRSLEFEIPIDWLDNHPEFREWLIDEQKVYVLGHIVNGKFQIEEILGGREYGDVCGW